MFASCDKRIKETSNENPVLPYYGKYLNAVAGANFLKALIKDVNMCVHAVIMCFFIKTVQLFNITDYDMNNETVKNVYHIDM